MAVTIMCVTPEEARPQRKAKSPNAGKRVERMNEFLSYVDMMVAQKGALIFSDVEESAISFMVTFKAACKRRKIENFQIVKMRGKNEIRAWIESEPIAVKSRKNKAA